MEIPDPEPTNRYLGLLKSGQNHRRIKSNYRACWGNVMDNDDKLCLHGQTGNDRQKKQTIINFEESANQMRWFLSRAAIYWTKPLINDIFKKIEYMKECLPTAWVANFDGIAPSLYCFYSLSPRDMTTAVLVQTIQLSISSVVTTIRKN